jgi:DNA repair exonuclease SbcCD ATPase subunit
MSVQFTVREITTNFITVDYEDGSWAQVPIRSDFTREQIETIIADFNHSQTTFASVEDVPFTVGETITAKNTKQTNEERVKEQEETYKNQSLDYKAIRSQSYPPVGDQLDALYWARNGDTSQLEVIDAKINEVKETYPKDMASMTREEFNAILEEIANNVLG